jgi:hypothetical protein
VPDRLEGTALGWCQIQGSGGRRGKLGSVVPLGNPRQSIGQDCSRKETALDWVQRLSCGAQELRLFIVCRKLVKTLGQDLCDQTLILECLFSKIVKRKDKDGRDWRQVGQEILRLSEGHGNSVEGALRLQGMGFRVWVGLSWLRGYSG